MVEDCAAKLTKFILIVTNVLVWCVSFVLIFGGLAIILQTDDYSYLFDGNLNTLPLASCILIGLGCFLFLVGFCACVGAIKETVCLLQLYFVLILVVIILEATLAGMAFFFHDKLNSIISDTMTNAIAEEYDGGDNAATETIDLIQREFHCCGSSNYTVWAESQWVQNNTGVIAPTSCCHSPQQEDCNTDVYKIYRVGCEDGFTSWYNDHYILIGQISAGLIIVEILALIFTCCLVSTIKSENYYA